MVSHITLQNKTVTSNHFFPCILLQCMATYISHALHKDIFTLLGKQNQYSVLQSLKYSYLHGHFVFFFKYFNYFTIKNKNKGPTDFYLLFHIHSRLYSQESKRMLLKTMSGQHGFKTIEQFFY